MNLAENGIHVCELKQPLTGKRNKKQQPINTTED